MTKRIAFVDSCLPNYQNLVAGLPTGTDVIVLNTHQDGIEQIAAALQGKSGLDAIDIFSHGSPGSISLGSSVLNEGNLADHGVQLTEIGSHLSNSGDIFLYGCNLAAGSTGKRFVDLFAAYTGANLAASLDPTGYAELGGSWRLDSVRGELRNAGLKVPSWRGLMALHHYWIFSADSGAGRELWITDLATARTRQLKDIYPDGFSSSPSNLTPLGGGKVLFSADDGNGQALWITDGTTNGTVQLLGAGGTVISSPSDFSAFIDQGSNKLLFTAEGINGRALWITDGTEAGTQHLMDAGFSTFHLSSGFIDLGNAHVLFAIDDTSTGQVVLWTTDGTQTGTQQLLDVNANAVSSSSAITALGNGHALFTAPDANGPALWITDGLATGTQQLLDANGNAIYSPSGITVLGNGYALFTVSDANGPALWITDGLPTGTQQLLDANGNAIYSPSGITALGNGHALFTVSDANGPALWITDGLPTGTQQLLDANGNAIYSPSGITALDNGHALFTVPDANGPALWITDGLPTGTQQLFDINGNAVSNPSGITDLGNGYALFTVPDATGPALWITDGLATGTQQLLDVNGNAIYSPTGITALGNGKALFTAQDANGSAVLWATDGTQTGTQQWVDANGIAVQNPSGFTPIDLNFTPALTGAATTALAAGSSPYTLSVNELTKGWTDDDGDTLSVTNLTSPQGSFTNNNNGTWTFIPSTNGYVGSVTLSYQVSDGTVSVSAPSLAFSIYASNSNVTWPNDPPSHVAHFAAVGSELLVNSATANDQLWPQIAVLNDGRFVVTWTDNSSATANSLNDYRVKAQVYEANGTPVGAELAVNSTDLGTSMGVPEITALNNGGFVMTWRATGAIKAQIYDANLAPVGSELSVNLAQGFNHNGQVTALSGGGFVVAWLNGNILFHVYSDAGVSVSGQQSVGALSDGLPILSQITALSNGGFVITWTDRNENAAGALLDDVKAQVFDAAGSSISGELQVNTATLGMQGSQQITALSDGGFVVTWVDDSQGVGGAGGDTSGSAIKAQIFSPSGAFAGHELLVNANVTGSQSNPQITALNNGRFVVTWEDGSGDSSGTAVKAQVFAPNGDRIGSEVLVNTIQLGSQWNQQITALNDGGFVVTWNDESPGFGVPLNDPAWQGNNIKAQAFAANGTRIGTEILVNTATQAEQLHPEITALNGGGFVIAWNDGSLGQGGATGDNSGFAIKAQVFNPISAGPNTNPTSSSTSINTGEDIAITGSLPPASDADGDAVSYSLATAAAHGTAVVNANGAYSYTPAANFNGGDSFSFKVSDGIGGSNSYSVTVTVNPVNDPPTTVFGSIANQSAGQDTPFSFQIPANTFNDVDGDQLSYEAGAPLPGWLSFDPATRTFSGTPRNSDLDLNDPEGITLVPVSITASDGLLEVSNFFYVEVHNVNDPPIASSASFSTDEDVVFYGSLPLASDADGDTVTYSLRDAPVNGSVWIDSNGNYSYTPNANFNGTDVFSFFVTDSHYADSPNYPVTVTVKAVNDAPEVAGFGIANQTASQGSPFSFSIPLETFYDVEDGNQLSYQATQSNGTPLPSWLGFDATTRTFSGTPPKLGYAGVLAIQVTATDVDGLSVSDAFDLDIAYVNDAPFAANHLVTTHEGSDYVFTASEFGYADPENQPLDHLIITSLPFAGILYLDSNGNHNIDSGEALATNALVYAADISHLSFKPVIGTSGSPYAIFDFLVSDGVRYSESSYSITVNVYSEQDVPGINGAMIGDGNGDGVADNTQSNVESLLTVLQTDPTTSVTTWATLVAQTGGTISNIYVEAAPANLPAEAKLPFGVYHFDVGGTAPGASQLMSVYITGDWHPQLNGEFKDLASNSVINGYWKQGADGVWYNVATHIEIDRGKLRIDFTLTDGSPITDADRVANGVIVDPGAPGHFTHHNSTPSFAIGDGKVTTAIGASHEQANSVTVQADGKILLGGFSANGAGNEFALVRYNPDGTLDSSFDFDGKLTTEVGTISDEAFSVAMQADGKILLGGASFNGSAYDFGLARYNPDGSLDSSFDFDGKLTTALGAFDARAFSVTVQADGKIILGGTVTSGTANAFTLVRYNSDGSLDTGFDVDGKLITGIGAGARGLSVSIQTDGKILLGGHALVDGTYNFALARYNPDGSLDSSFDFDGKLTTPVLSSDDLAYSVTLQADGKILLAGGSWNGSNFDFALVRYNPDGSLDSGFGTGGKLIADIGVSNDEAYSVTVQADGKILLGGYSNNGSDNDFALARYNPDGSIDTGFGYGGKVTTPIGASTEQAFSISLQADGKILLSGYSRNGSDNDFAVVRYNPDGSLDTRFDLRNTLDGNPSYTENGPAVVLDSNVQVYDAELAAIGHYAGASLTLVRHGGANSEDGFSAKPGGNLAALTEDNDLTVDGITIGMVTTNSNGTLLLTFNANANQNLINSALEQIAYSNSSDAPPASVQIDWTFSDGNTGYQGAGGALSVTGSTTVSITAVNDAPQAVPVNLGHVSEDTAIAIDTATLLAGTSDIDSANLSISALSLSNPDQGSLHGDALNGWTFTPAQDFNGAVSFNYTVSDGSLTATSTASLSVDAINDAPSFGSGGGIVTTNFGYYNSGASTSDIGRSLALQADGKILLGGSSSLNSSGLVFAMARYNADGLLDTNFSGDGIITTDIGSTSDQFDFGYSTTLQADGKILLGGYSQGAPGYSDFALVRYNSDGSLDSSFDGDGKLTTDIGTSYDLGFSVALQADGKILLGGLSQSVGGSNFALVRYNSDGSLDSSFDGDGIVTTGHSGLGFSVVIQPDGKILLGGIFYGGGYEDFALVRYNSDGSLDSSFDGDGIVTSNIGTSEDRGFSVALQADGRILLGGLSWNGSYYIPALSRYNSDGTLDTSFSGDGIVITDLAMLGYNVTVTVQADGKILLGGSNVNINGTGFDFALVRYNSNGTLDTSFSDDGIVTTHFVGGLGEGYSVLVQADGKILLGGYSLNGSDNDFALVRYNPDGSLDSSFVNSLNGHSSYTENGVPVVLDRDMQVFDVELATIGHYAGASLMLVRHGGANGEDVFSTKFGGSLTSLTEGSGLIVDGVTIGMVTANSNGALLLTFNGNATQTLVNSTLQQIAYSNLSENPPAPVQIDWTFSDGNTGSQGAGGSLSAVGITTVNITGVNDNPAGMSTAVLSSGVENRAYIVTAADLLQGWSDVDGDTLSISGLTADHGTASDNGNNTFTIIPDSSYFGPVTLNYAVIDNHGGSAAATLGFTLIGALVGGNGNDTLTGTTGDDVLDGGLGDDKLIGGLGNDTYYVDSALDKIVEAVSAGIDQVFSSAASFTLASNVENLTLLTSGVNGKGNSLTNLMVGNDASNLLEGSGGTDNLSGLGGNDSLDGGSGVDTLSGGLDDDTYYVDNVADIVIEQTGEGIDQVFSKGAFSLAAFAAVERLTLLTSGNATGNGLNNTLVGSATNNILDGGTGADTLIGGDGNDTYIVDNPGDVVIETGIVLSTADVVKSAINYALGLGSNVEKLTLTGTATVGTGNELANTLTANSNGNGNTLSGGDGNDSVNGSTGNDSLIGGEGADALKGNGGNDNFIVNITLAGTLEDTITAGAGTDTVQVTFGGTGNYAGSGATLVAGSTIENYDISGTAAASLNVNGNGLGNILTGNSAANTLDGITGNDTLYGGDGDDLLIGGSGNDNLTGGDGADTFWFNKAASTLANQDVITDFVSGTDRLQFSKAVLSGLTTLGQFTTGDQRFYAGSDGLAHDSSDRLIYNTTMGELNYDSNGSVAGGTQAVLLVLTGAPSLADTGIFVV